MMPVPCDELKARVDKLEADVAAIMKNLNGAIVAMVAAQESFETWRQKVNAVIEMSLKKPKIQ